MHRSEVARPPHFHLISAQVVDQRLDVGEDAFGVGLVPHDHHVLHLQQRHAVGVGPEEAQETGCMRRRRGKPGGWERAEGGAEKDFIFYHPSGAGSGFLNKLTELQLSLLHT